MDENKNIEEEPQKPAHEDAPNAEEENGLNEQQQKKLIFVLAYLFGILFFLPLLVYPQDANARFHANQALILLLTAFVGEVLFSILTLIPYVGVVFAILCGLLGLLILVACIYCIVCILKGDKGELPIIGKIRIIR